MAEEKGLHLILQGDGEVNADRLMLSRALGSVSISARPEAVSIGMENTGHAIPPDYLERVFDRYFRVDPSRQRSSEGTGLGLAITKSIIVALSRIGWHSDHVHD
ncbi:MAG: ATP-binding protein [Rhodoferax sp.]